MRGHQTYDFSTEMNAEVLLTTTESGLSPSKFTNHHLKQAFSSCIRKGPLIMI